MFPETKTMIENWDCSFPPEDKPFPKTENTDSLAQLLSGFFDFWQTIDFESQLVCTRTGKTRTVKVKEVSLNNESLDLGPVSLKFRIAFPQYISYHFSSNFPLKRFSVTGPWCVVDVMYRIKPETWEHI
jgi:hypothetical protein